jgi:hypothetical protein
MNTILSWVITISLWVITISVFLICFVYCATGWAAWGSLGLNSLIFNKSVKEDWALSNVTVTVICTPGSLILLFHYFILTIRHPYIIRCVYPTQKFVFWVRDNTQKLRKTNWTDPRSRAKLNLTKKTDISNFRPIFVFFWLTAVEQKVSLRLTQPNQHDSFEPVQKVLWYVQTIVFAIR